MAKFISGKAATPAAFFHILSDHMLANGWTIYHKISTTAGREDWIFRGGALDATADNRPFLRLKLETASTLFAHYLIVMAYADYEATASLRDDGDALAGIWECGSTTLTIISLNETDAAAPSEVVYKVRANSVAIAIATNVNSLYSKLYAGYMRRGFPVGLAGVTRATGAITAGATVVNVDSDMTGKLAVGQKVHIMAYAHNSASANRHNMELATIQSIAAGSITFTVGLTKNYDAGAVIGTNPLPILATSESTNQYPFATAYLPCTDTGTRTSATSHSVASSAGPLSLTTSTSTTDPTPLNIANCGIQMVSSTVWSNYGTMYHFHLASRFNKEEVIAAGSQVMILDDTVFAGQNVGIRSDT